MNIKDWCKNHFEVINQLRINTDNSHHRYDVILLINGIPVVQIELKTLGISPRRAMEQIVEYKNDPGNGYTKTLLCFMQLFIVSNRTSTYYFANNNARHFAFNAEERFLPIYEFADEDNKKITQIYKCVFVVDRKDLDRQTREEFNRFQEGCVEENTNTATLVRRLLSDDYADKVIVTTIQKLFQQVQSQLESGRAQALRSHEDATPSPDGLRHSATGFKPLNIACVFSPPADGNADVKQIQEDLPQESEEYAVQPGEDADQKKKENERKKAALKTIVADYNSRYGTNHTVSEFDLYCQDVQKRIKDQQWPNSHYPAAQKIDITIVVDMLLTGFDSKYLNTLYVDKKLKHHGLIQAFSRTNRVLNGTKPYGNILDFRSQQAEVDAAIALFSGKKTTEQAREIWLVDKPPVVIKKLQDAVQKLSSFMKTQGLECEPSAMRNIKGDMARAAFINHFKEVQRLKTQLDQYTDHGRLRPVPHQTHRGPRDLGTQGIRGINESGRAQALR